MMKMMVVVVVVVETTIIRTTTIIITIILITTTTVITRSTQREQTFARRVHSESTNLRQATDLYQNLMAHYLYHPQSMLKISLKSIHKFSSNMPTDR